MTLYNLDYLFWYTITQKYNFLFSEFSQDAEKIQDIIVIFYALEYSLIVRKTHNIFSTNKEFKVS